MDTNKTKIIIFYASYGGGHLNAAKSINEYILENYKNVDIKFTLRLPEELHQDIASYSNKHNISMNTLILNCIEYAMSNREEEDK